MREIRNITGDSPVFTKTNKTIMKYLILLLLIALMSSCVDTGLKQEGQVGKDGNIIFTFNYKNHKYLKFGYAVVHDPNCACNNSHEILVDNDKN